MSTPAPAAAAAPAAPALAPGGRAFFIAFAVGALALLALAVPAPKLATGIVVLLIITVLFVHAAPISSAVGGATASLGRLAGTTSN